MCFHVFNQPVWHSGAKNIWWGYFFLFAQKINFSFDRPVSDYHWILHYFIFVWSKWIINCLIFLDLDDKKYKYFEKWSDINCVYWNFTCNIYKKYFITFCSLNFIIRTVHSEINIKFFFILLHINHGLCRESICDPENEPKTQRVKVIREQVHANNKVIIDWGN